MRRSIQRRANEIFGEWRGNIDGWNPISRRQQAESKKAEAL